MPLTGTTLVECSRPRVPLYPYDKTNDGIICHYSRRHPRVQSPTGGPCRCSSPKTRMGRSRPHTAIGFASHNQEPLAWNSRHHITGSAKNSGIYTLHRCYFDHLPGEVPRSTRRLPKKFAESAADEDHQVERVEDSKDHKKRFGRRRATDVLGNLLEQQVQMLYDATKAIPGLQAFADFYMWCIKKFKNLTRCWRLIDPNLDMKVTKLEFLTSLRKYEFQGDARGLFQILDRDRSGSLSYYHFDPTGAEDLALLQKFFIKHFGGLQEAFKILDGDGDGKVSPEEFIRLLERHGFQMEGPVICLFEMLDLNRDRKLSLEEVSFLDKWNCPMWLQAEPDFEEAKTFKENLLAEYDGNSIRAWHQGLDKNRSMRVCWWEFAGACRHEHVPKDRQANVWRAYDHNLSGWLSLKEFDKEAYDLLLKFKMHCKNVYGSVSAAFSKIDSNSNGWLSRKEFQQVENSLELNHHEGDTLFKGLDFNDTKQITFAKLKYLDTWSVEDEQAEDEFWEIIGPILIRGSQRLSKPTTNPTQPQSEG